MTKGPIWGLFLASTVWLSGAFAVQKPLPPLSAKSVDDFADNAGADGAAAFADREAEAVFHRFEAIY